VALKAVTSQVQFLAVVVFALIEIVGVVVSGLLSERIGPRAVLC
jgi:hypothetical protein